MKSSTQDQTEEVSAKREFLGESIAGVVGVFVAVAVGVILFGDRYSSNEFWKETITTSIGLVIAAAIAIPVVRWQKRRKAEREAARAAVSEARVEDDVEHQD